MNQHIPRRRVVLNFSKFTTVLTDPELSPKKILKKHIKQKNKIYLDYFSHPKHQNMPWRFVCPILGVGVSKHFQRSVITSMSGISRDPPLQSLVVEISRNPIHQAFMDRQIYQKSSHGCVMGMIFFHDFPTWFSHIFIGLFFFQRGDRFWRWTDLWREATCAMDASWNA